MKKPETVYLRDYTPPDYLVDRVFLRFELGEEATLVRSRLRLRRNPAVTAAASRPLLLDGQDLELLTLRLNGVELSSADYRSDDTRLEVAGVPEYFELDVVTRIYPHKNTALEGLYQSGGNFCTQCEAEGFRKITYFLDRPDVMASYTTTIVADKTRYPVLLSNGNLVDSGELDQGRHWATWNDPFKKPSYLFALVAGHLAYVEDVFVTCSGRTVTLRIYVEPENLDQCEHAMRSLKQAMAWDEAVFGREYDLDIYMIVAVGDFNMGAMENKGLNIFNTKFVLAKPEAATDIDYQGIESVIAHEYFHNWTGNRVTCRDWFQLSLKEGLTVFRDQQFSADMGSAGVKRISDVRILRASQFSQDAGPMAHPVRPQSYMEINNFYTVTVYNKGAEVVRMIYNLLGQQGFRRGMDLYFERHDGQAVTTDDFVNAMEGASGIDLGQFRRWYDQAGTPELACEGVYDPAQRTYTLKLSQSCPPTPGQEAKEPFHIPVAVGLLDDAGNDLPLRLEDELEPGATTRMLELREPEAVFRFVDVPTAPVPSPLRGFSAPVKLRMDWRDEELEFRLAHDSDDFNRWEAGQMLATRLILRLVQEREQAIGWQRPEPFCEAFARVIGATGVDAALRTEVLTLPSESYLAEQMARVDVDGIHEARNFVRRALAQRLREDWFVLYQTHADTGTYRIDTEAIGRRRLKNRALEMLMQLNEPDILGLCLEQFRQARNMTDELAALGLLANTDCPERSDALAAFHRRWRHEPLVVDKWFALQATSRLPGTLGEVQALVHHPDFHMENPNKVRALIGSFCQANPVRFHAADGSGYRFVADHVLMLNGFNPQIAARLLSALTRWRKFDEARQGLMRAQLERILAEPSLSPDVYEIASKTLDN